MIFFLEVFKINTLKSLVQITGNNHLNFFYISLNNQVNIPIITQMVRDIIDRSNFIYFGKTVIMLKVFGEGINHN